MSGNTQLAVFMLVSGLGLSGASYASAGLQRYYASPMGEAKWSVSKNKLRCGLSLGIPNYGVAYFEQNATKDPHFIVHKFQQVARRIPAKVIARPPVWKPKDKSWFVSSTVLKPGKFGIFLDRDPSLKLLNYLANGLQAVFKYRSEQGFAVTLVLSPIHFQGVYQEYQRCVGSLLPFNYEDVKDSVFQFALGAYDLSPEDKGQLRRIADYSKASRKIEAIVVSGYTDDLGRRSYNNAIAQMRADAVANYLRSNGVSENLMRVTWYGEEKPVASNDTEEGRAKNRRVEVEIKLKDA